MEPLTTSSVTFETALGRCAIRWTAAGIAGVALPQTRPLAGPALESGVAIPESVRDAIDGIVAVLAGTQDDLRSVALDERGIDPFRRAVYAATREIAPGTTRSYGDVARSIDRPEAARDVGTALARNAYPIIVPCHRVVGSKGELTGYSGPGGISLKKRLLELERAAIHAR